MKFEFATCLVEFSIVKNLIWNKGEYNIIKKHLRKIVSLVLVLAMTSVISVPGFAETKDSGKEFKNNGQKIVDNFTKAENTKVIEQVGIATYFFESTNDYTVCIMWDRNKVALHVRRKGINGCG